MKIKATFVWRDKLVATPQVCLLCKGMEAVMKDAVEFSSFTQSDPKGDLPFSFASLCLSCYISQHFQNYLTDHLIVSQTKYIPKVLETLRAPVDVFNNI